MAQSEWDAADAKCKAALGAGWCAVAGPDGHPNGHCSNAIMVKPGDGNVKKRTLEPSQKSKEVFTDKKVITLLKAEAKRKASAS